MPLRPLVRTPANEAERLQRQEGRYVWLLLTTLVPMLLLPLTASPDRSSLVVLAVVFSLLILQSLYTLDRPVSGLHALIRRGGFTLLGLLSLIGIWIPPLKGSWQPLSLKLTVLTVLSLFFLVASVRLVQRLARAPRVNARVMAGASAGYLLLGISGGVIATATDLYVPGSFHLTQVSDQELLIDRLTYFSFVTISGLGPGDIVAGNAVGERFVMLLSVSSTLYVALLVGLLLGRFIASQEVELLEEDYRIGAQNRPADTIELEQAAPLENPRD